MSDDGFIFNTKGLDQLMAALNGKLPVAHIGILGAKNARTGVNEHGQTNVEIGAKHEFGDDGMPTRSFIRMPLIEHFQEFLSKAGAFDEDSLDKVLKSGSIREWVARLGLVAEDVIFEGFQTGGFGKWKPSDMRFKKNHQTLVETQQLRNSITSEVVE